MSDRVGPPNSITAFPIDHSEFLISAWYGGEGGIRTHGTVASSRALQARRFVHSRTSPRAKGMKGGILTRVSETGKALPLVLEAAGLSVTMTQKAFSIDQSLVSERNRFNGGAVFRNNPSPVQTEPVSCLPAESVGNPSNIPPWRLSFTVQRGCRAHPMTGRVSRPELGRSLRLTHLCGRG